jgi:hypothetical protein
MRIIKTYQSNTYGSLGLTLDKPEGGSVYVSFGGGSRYLDTKSMFTTSDPILQELMEKSPFYGKHYRLKDTVKIEEKQDKNKERFETVVFQNKAEAKEWFKENLPDVAVSYLKSQKAFIDRGKEYGYIILFDNIDNTEE